MVLKSRRISVLLPVLASVVALVGYSEEKISYRLEINVVGGGTVSPGPGTYYYPAGTTVFLSAIPNAEWAFDRWEGSISSTELYAQVYMNGHKTVTAVFVEPDWRLTITHSGDAQGTTFPPAGVYGFINGRMVGISSATVEGVYFGGWSGDVWGTDEFVQVYMDSDKTVDARFTSTGHILNVYVVGEGGATPGPMGNPHRFSSDVRVNVRTYQTNPSWRFHHWEGDIDENEPSSNILFNLTMDRDREVTAVFIEKPYYRLTIEVVGEGQVSLRKGFEEPLILGTGTHEFSYIEWSFIRCESIEVSSEWKFLRWEGDFGDTSPTYPRISFSMDRDRYVRCIFTDLTNVPNVVGTSQSEAVSAINSAWLRVEEILEICSDVYPSGYVVDQAPPAGMTVEIGSSVSIWVSTGPCPIPVPDVVGRDLDEAETILSLSQLMLGNVSQECNNQVEAGIVISQSPSPGELVTPGSNVDIVVSTGPCPVRVPNILWQTRVDAENMIFEAGLSIGIVTEQCDDNVPFGRVINQYPPAGQEVPVGSAVNFAVSNGSCYVIVPNIVMYSENLARFIIDNAGLTVGEITEQCHNSIRAGIVISQSPSAGERIPVGSAVDFTISSGPCGEGSQEGIFEGVVEGGVEGEQEGMEGSYEGGVEEGEALYHSADRNGNWKIDLSELLRCVQFFSSGGYHCALPGEVSEDGYIPGYDGDKNCDYHSLDYNPQDWIISLSELLRAIQFFNIGRYHPCATGEDGFCPG